MQQVIHSGQVNGLLRKGVDFFYQKNVTSPDKALTLSDGDWLYAFGESAKNRQRMLSLLTYIKVTDDNKYWLDMEEYERFLENTKQKGNRMGIAVIFILLSLSSWFCILQLSKYLLYTIQFIHHKMKSIAKFFWIVGIKLGIN